MLLSPTLSTVSYLGAIILFILSLGGLSNPETSRRGNLFGMVGMAIAVLATLLGPQVAPKGIAWIVGAMAVGGMVEIGRASCRGRVGTGEGEGQVDRERAGV